MRWRLPLAILQERIFQQLSADLVGTPIEARVWDSPPDGTDFPIVLIGDMTATSDPHWAKNVPVLDVVVTVDVYSKELGMEQVQALANTVSVSMTKLPFDLSADNFKFIQSRLLSAQTLREFDGVRLIRHALLQFNYKVQDVTPQIN